MIQLLPATKPTINFNTSHLSNMAYPFLLHFVKSNLCWCPFGKIRFLGFHLFVILAHHHLLQMTLFLLILLLPKNTWNDRYQWHMLNNVQFSSHHFQVSWLLVGGVLNWTAYRSNMYNVSKEIKYPTFYPS